MTKVAIYTLDMTMNGASKALIQMLKRLDYSKVEIDVYVGVMLGEFINEFPKEVRVIQAPRYERNLRGVIREVMKHPIHFNKAFAQKKKLTPEASKIVECEAVSLRMPIVNKQYDVAISYRHYNIDTFYVINNLQARRKFFWIHGEVNLSPDEVKVLKKYYDKYDRIFPVSQTAKESFVKYFPQYEEKCQVAYNVLDVEELHSLAQVGDSFEDNFDGMRLLTIGRLSEEKGYDLAIEACKILRDNKTNFRWYVVGEGKEHIKYKEKITEYGLGDFMILLGMKENPYRMLRDCDIYVQCSLSESYCLTVAEARAFNKPIVATDIRAMHEQLENRRTGVFCDLNGIDLANKIVGLINNEKIRNQLTQNLLLENANTFEVIDIFMKEIEE